MPIRELDLAAASVCLMPEAQHDSGAFDSLHAHCAHVCILMSGFIE